MELTGHAPNAELPERLRETAEHFGSMAAGGIHPQRLVWIRQAADEIERLQRLLDAAETSVERLLLERSRKSI